MTVRSAFAAVTAFIVAVLIGSLIIRILKRNGIVQAIREDGPKKHLKKQGTPTMGGLIMLIPVLLSTLLWARFDNNYIYIVLFSIVWFAFIGFLDDFLKMKVGTKGLSVKNKLLMQFAGALAIIFMYLYFSQEFRFATHINVPFMKSPVELPVWLFIIIAALLIAGWSNAVNLTDGLDGLASGLALLVFATLVVMSYIIGNVNMSEYLLLMNVGKAAEITVICSAFVGAILGFLWFNAYPAQVFMGDTGALMLGGVIGTVAVLIKQEILMLVVGVIFMIEMFSVILQVTSYKMTKKRLFRMAPLHHHYQLKGVSEPKIIIRFWIVAVVVLLLTLSTLKLR
ncbi:MAG TPA: phospho-N-acetylmuramoyl-pentapeptide-transferase [bacterium]|nr:phospho-N-acetylmuramoyl-pentapeptide-transferase [bacterium]